MRFPRRGPRITAPAVPAVLVDLYRDLRDRRLLPLVALLLVAIVAAPILLHGGSSEQPPAPAAGAGEAGGAAARGSSLDVVAAAPGLRDYHKRLHGKPTDPFRQRYTGVPASARLRPAEPATSGSSANPAPAAPTAPPTGGAAGGGEGDGGSSSGSHGPVPSGPAPRGPGAGAGAGSPANGTEGARLFGWRPTVRFGPAGSQDLTTHEQLPLGSLLPKQAPVMVFLGVTQDGVRALFSLTDQVTQVRGEGGCVGGRSNCRILSLRTGQAVDLVVDSGQRTYRLSLTGIDFVELPTPRHASGAAHTGARAAPRWTAGVGALRPAR